jgi:hypothetical protein
LIYQLIKAKEVGKNFMVRKQIIPNGVLIRMGRGSLQPFLNLVFHCRRKCWFMPSKTINEPTADGIMGKTIICLLVGGDSTGE